ncbi:MAG: 30S ribosomal protein S12 methylthiotransferase RimO [Gammaproteobacteria bacterium]|nr:30S ribosomal protein S12 methylthiotransferase RimO [Gammaproteobacteria bacterium]MBQ0841021.1 30S ribosomal protein S12 methylthiotransferase RimO [Gammaproteobacteria bacterium]
MANPKVGFISLGCPKALVDSERILTQLKLDGYDVTPSYADAEVVVVNTCGFLDSAKQESLDAIGEAMAENGRVIVTGCMGGEEGLIRDTHPGVLAVTGAHQYEEVVSAVHDSVAPPTDHNPYTDLLPPQGVKLTPRHYSYLKISEGCNHSCSFCIIPDLRGKLVSRPVGEVLDEAQRLVKSGVRELLVISQDTSAYGVDIKYRTGFWQGKPVKSRMLELCEALGDMDAWVRLHYVYPYPHVDNVIPLMAEGKILPYLDIPFQHSSPSVLKAMKRPGHQEKTLERIQRWREICPDLTLRSTFIAGFPGETEDDFKHLLDWLQEAQLDRVGCFKYEAVDGAPANNLPNPVPEEIKQERWERLMETQQVISTARLAKKVGSTIEVLVDEVDEEGAVARSWADAPDIDGNVYLNGECDLKPGDRLTVRVEHADEYDLWASPVSAT